MTYFTRKLGKAMRCLVVGLMLALVACGSGGNGGQRVHSTLAYVVSECHEDAHSLTGTARQRLQVVRDDGDPLTVAEIPTFGRLPAVGLCPLYGTSRNGSLGAYGLGFQRMAVSPDGSGIVFEVNFNFSIFRVLGARDPLSPEQEGIFFVRADGTGLRRLGDPSREYAQRLGSIPSPAMPTGPTYINLFFGFSPDGKSVAFTDRGPGPAGEDAAQVVIMDIETGTRTAVTRLPAVTSPDPSNPVAPAILQCFWLDDETIGFTSHANPNGLNPEEIFRDFSVKIDGTNLSLISSPPLVLAALPDSHVVPQFTITQPVMNSSVGFLSVPGTPVSVPPDYFPPDAPIQELFVLAGEQVLQLTKFNRVDSLGPILDARDQRVFFAASADPLGTNPSENCQVFSIDTDGGNLRQLTRFAAAEKSGRGCFNANIFQPGCLILSTPIFDSEEQTLLFDSDCDPFGTNPAGNQFFKMAADGGGLRQITSTRGMVTAPDGSVDVELPGPLAIQFF